MDQTVLVSEQIDAGAEFAQRFHGYLPVKVAFWLYPSTEARWSLYVAPEHFDPAQTDRSYAEVLRITQQMRNPYLDPFQVKLISPVDPLALAAQEIQERYSAPLATRYNGPSLGGTSIEGAYLYPMPLVAGPQS